MRQKSLYFLGLAALIGTTILVVRRGFDSKVFMESFRNFHPLWIALSAAGVFPGYILRAIRWQRLLIPLKSVELGALVSGTILGFAGIYAIGRVGEVVRPLWVARTQDVPIAGSFASIVVERIFDTLMILALLAIGLGTSDIGGSHPVAALSRLGWLLLFASIATLTMLVFSHRYVHTIKGWIPFQSVQSVFETFTRGTGPLADPANMAIITLHSILVWVAIALQFWLMLVGLNLDVGLPGACLILAVSSLGSLAQLPGIGGGFQAAFVFTVTSFLGVGTEVAVAAALIAWLVLYLPTLAAGGLYMMWKGISASELVPSHQTQEIK